MHVLLLNQHIPKLEPRGLLADRSAGGKETLDYNQHTFLHSKTAQAFYHGNLEETAWEDRIENSLFLLGMWTL